MRIINLYQETLGIVSDCCKVQPHQRHKFKQDILLNILSILTNAVEYSDLWE